MSVATDVRQVQYEGNDATTVFPVDFPFKDSSQIKVYWTYEPESISEQLLVEGVDYEVTGGAGDVGEVTFQWVPEATGIILIERTVPFLQPTEFPVGGPYSPIIHERALDNLEYQIQQLNDRVGALEAALEAFELGNATIVIRTLEFTTAAAPEDTFPVETSVPDGFTAEAIAVGKVVNVGDPTDEVQTGPVVGAWSQSGTNISIEHISGLEPDTQYAVTVFIVAEEA